MTHSSENTPQDLPKFSTRTVATVAGALVLAMIALFFLGFWPRHERIKERESMAQAVRDRPLIVQTVRPELTTRPIELVLPADIHAYASTALYARTNGYLASWTVDINDRVKKGDLMAVLSAPDTDAQLKEAEANLNQQEVNYQLAAATDGRYRGLIPTQGVTQQQLDQFHSAAEQAKANVVSSSAIVDRLKTLVSFERITAPFDGVVTARSIDTGQLIDTGAGKELFHMQALNVLRVYTNVPQVYTTNLKRGSKIDVTFPEYPGRTFQGTLVRTSDAIDPTSRTLLVEVDVDNRKGELLPGSLAQVHFKTPAAVQSFIIPVSAIIFRREGTRVGVLGSDNIAHVVPVTIGEDDGATVQIVNGLKAEDLVIQDPPDSLIEGEKVSPQNPNGQGRNGQTGPEPK